eukprot:TRINITY_DN3889_c0_g1_i1.p1 TRINITY_DN3889_c0_g1~~TRINITY_DN3889_c0_g1_i1.p1  ORF type:complete len:987 (+),score=219.95 TRINITY_DN3889_c0_g1_i1:60-3020(+)
MDALAERVLNEYAAETQLVEQVQRVIQTVFAGDELPRNPFRQILASLQPAEAKQANWQSSDQSLILPVTNDVTAQDAEFRLSRAHGSQMLWGLPHIMRIADVMQEDTIQQILSAVTRTITHEEGEYYIRMFGSVSGGFAWPRIDPYATELTVVEEHVYEGPKLETALGLFVRNVTLDVVSHDANPVTLILGVFIADSTGKLRKYTPTQLSTSAPADFLVTVLSKGEMYFDMLTQIRQTAFTHVRVRKRFQFSYRSRLPSGLSELTCYSNQRAFNMLSSAFLSRDHADQAIAIVGADPLHATHVRAYCDTCFSYGRRALDAKELPAACRVALIPALLHRREDVFAACMRVLQSHSALLGLAADQTDILLMILYRYEHKQSRDVLHLIQELLEALKRQLLSAIELCSSSEMDGVRDLLKKLISSFVLEQEEYLIDEKTPHILQAIRTCCMIVTRSMDISLMPSCSNITQFVGWTSAPAQSDVRRPQATAVVPTDPVINVARETKYNEAQGILPPVMSHDAVFCQYAVDTGLFAVLQAAMLELFTGLLHPNPFAVLVSHLKRAAVRFDLCQLTHEEIFRATVTNFKVVEEKFDLYAVGDDSLFGPQCSVVYVDVPKINKLFEALRSSFGASTTQVTGAFRIAAIPALAGDAGISGLLSNLVHIDMYYHVLIDGPDRRRASQLFAEIVVAHLRTMRQTPNHLIRSLCFGDSGAAQAMSILEQSLVTIQGVAESGEATVMAGFFAAFGQFISVQLSYYFYYREAHSPSLMIYPKQLSSLSFEQLFATRQDAISWHSFVDTAIGGAKRDLDLRRFSLDLRVRACAAAAERDMCLTYRLLARLSAVKQDTARTFALYRMLRSDAELCMELQQVATTLSGLTQTACEDLDFRKRLDMKIYNATFDEFRAKVIYVCAPDRCLTIAATKDKVTALFEELDTLKRSKGTYLQIPTVDILRRLCNLILCVQFSTADAVHANATEIEALLAAFRKNEDY